ncbi:MAG: PIG-L family deacetylase [Egibacteraceae bacterium]
MSTMVFLHAHPDDEAIFTGGTMCRLVGAGHRVVLVLATGGEQGVGCCPLPAGRALADLRATETMAAARLLGVARVVFLGYADSGMPGDAANDAPRAFGRADVEEAARRVAVVCVEEAAVALGSYDPDGIYPHPDHLQVHRVGARATAIAGLATTYEATVDYEYLHFVDVHLVEGASRSLAERSEHSGVFPGSPLGFRTPSPHSGVSSGSPLGFRTPAQVGLPTAEITTVVDVRGCLEVKRAAMAAHASQIPETDLGVPAERFAQVYGYEWFVRRGPRGLIEQAGLTDWGRHGAATPFASRPG